MLPQIRTDANPGSNRLHRHPKRPAKHLFKTQNHAPGRSTDSSDHRSVSMHGKYRPTRTKQTRVNPHQTLRLRPFVIRGWLCAALLTAMTTGCTWMRPAETTTEVTERPAAPTTDGYWYCYGDPQTHEWHCQDDREDARIAKVGPRPPPASSSRTVTPAPASTVPPPVSPATIASSSPSSPSSPSVSSADAPPPSTSRSAPSSAATAASAQSARGASAAPPQTDGSGGPGDATVLRQPPEYFTVQLIALQDQRGVVEYAQRNGLPEPLYARIRTAGSNSYVLLLGIYPTREEAETASVEWSRTKTPKVDPWIRQMAPLQDAVRKAGLD